MALLIWDGTFEEKDRDVLSVTPVTHVKILDGEPFEIHRCEADGGIVTWNNLDLHLGHKVKQPVILKEDDLALMVKGVIK